ncbi:MAG: F390 synthetase-related protein [Candidatus Heimdallarchaeaceae archaeon]
MGFENSFILFFLACKYRFRHLKGSKLKQYQKKRLKKIVDYAVERSLFFKDYYRDYDINDVFSLPTVNKRLMMNNFTQYNTVGFSKEELLKFCLEVEKTRSYEKRYKGYSVAMSSGTSGNKGIVITSPREEKYLKAAFFSRFNFPKTLKLNIAFILRVTTPAFNINKFGQKLTYFSLLTPLDDIVRGLNKLKPNVLAAPPSMLNLLAKEQNNGKLTIKPKKIVSFAEILYLDIKTKVEETFNTRIDEIYQASEGPIAMTCKHGSLHINEDLLAVELFNTDGTPTEPGEKCHKMIVSDLYKTSQPIIRFELNDIIKISTEKCSCGSGFRVIDEIVGRSDDLLIGIDSVSNKIVFIFPDYIRRAIISVSDFIEDYSVVQISENKIEVKLKMLSKEHENEKIVFALKKAIGDVFHKYKCNIPEVYIQFKHTDFYSPAKKLVRVRRSFNTEN